MIDGFVFQLIMLTVSLVALAGSSHFTIKSIEKLIELTGLSDASAGFIILSIVTTLPEITVASFAIYGGVPAISIGDILGSHVFNIGIVIGVLAVLGSLKACCTHLMIELVDLLFLASIIPLLLVIFQITDTSPLFSSPLVGVVLLGIFAFSIYRMSKTRSPALLDPTRKAAKMKGWKRTCLFAAMGAALVIVTSRVTVSSASEIASLLGIFPVLIGARIVAVGTSLPELAFGLTAVRRGRVHLALGDAIGANLTTTTLVLGLVFLLSPFQVNLTAFAEILLFVLASNLILWRYLTKGGVSQVGGIVLIMIYVLFQAVF
jgi:cation:H+ antiporter